MFTVASTDGVELAVHEVGGDTSGRPLIFCHATGFHGRVWRAVAAEFPDRRCLALDFRGYGDSTEQHGDLRWAGFADDVLAVVDAIDIDDAQAIGHSKGGAAMLLAELARPGTFDRLVCFEPIVMPTPPPDVTPQGENHLASITRHRREHFDSYDEAIERFGSKPPLGSLRADVLDDYVRHGFRRVSDGITLKARREHEARTYETGSQHGAFDRLSEIGCPVLVAHGGDGGFPAVAAPMIAEALPQGSLLAMTDLGHFGPLEDPPAFAHVAGAFLRDEPGGGS